MIMCVYIHLYAYNYIYTPMCIYIHTLLPLEMNVFPPHFNVELAVFTFQTSPIPASSFFGRLRVGFPWVIGRSDMLHGMFDICTIHPNNDPFNGPLWFIQSSPFFSIRCD